MLHSVQFLEALLAINVFSLDPLVASHNKACVIVCVSSFKGECTDHYLL